MNLSRKISEALLYIDNGQIPPFWELLPKQYDPTDRSPDGYLQTVDAEANGPSWVAADSDWEYTASNPPEPSYEELFLSLDTAGNDFTTELTPSDPVIGCRFHILNAKNFETISVTATGESPDGDEIRKETEFVSGSQMVLNAHPVSITFDEPVERITLSIVGDGEENSIFKSLAGRVTGDRNLNLSMSAPTTIRDQTDETPIFLISIDTFRHDHIDTFESVLSVLGDDAVVPAEPRTQGRYTRPSHGSMLTGVHPGTHGYCTGYNHQLDKGIPITALSPDLQTLPEVLTEHGYTCGACTSWGSVTPDYGFGRGFQSFTHENRDWKEYKRDGSTVVSKAQEWTRHHISTDQGSAFYFMHIFDAHFPYLSSRTLSPESAINVKTTDKFKADYINTQPHEYDELTTYAETVQEPEYLADLKRYYRNSLEYVSAKLTEFFAVLKQRELLDDSLVIIVGDHGEEFLEKGVVGHATLNDNNIRPGMIVKPPKNEEFPVPDQIDYIDIFPTVSEYVTGKVPDQCVGRSWLRTNDTDSDNRVRTTEAFTGASTYAISVEKGGYKGVFAYEADIPDRPTESQVENGLKKKDFSVVADEREGLVSNQSVPESMKTTLETHAVEFISDQEDHYRGGKEVELSGSVEDRLEELGYK